MEDFGGAEVPAALTTHFENLGQFRVTGEGLEGNTAGLVNLTSAGLNGVGRMTTMSDTDKDSIFIRTGVIFDVALMGPLVAECRIKSETITTQQCWFGFANISGTDDCIEDEIVDTVSGGTTIDDLTATGMCGFLRTSELTAVAEFHAIYKGGTTTCSSTSTNQELGVTYTAGDFMILRLEIDPNGDARWYVDGVLKKTVVTAAPLTTDMALILGLETQTAGAASMDVDYIWVKANRDWTV